MLHGAVPLLLNHNDNVHEILSPEDDTAAEIPLGARVIRAVRAYDALTSGAGGTPMTPQRAVEEIRKESTDQIGAEVLNALERVVRRTTTARTPEHAVI